jgi:DNA-binding NarL/FixJ family response regulator
MAEHLVMSLAIRVLLWTNTATLARGFTALAGQQSGIETLASCSDLTDMLTEAALWQPDVILLDVTGPVDFHCLSEIRKCCPTARVVLWMNNVSVEVAYQARSVGIRGVLRKDATEETLLRCLQHVVEGEPWFERSLLNSLLEAREVRLSPREQQLTKLVAQGLSNKQLAAELMISEGTVKVYLAKLFRKLNVHDRYELAVHGLKRLGVTGMEVAVSNADALTFGTSVVLESRRPQ